MTNGMKMLLMANRDGQRGRDGQERSRPRSEYDGGEEMRERNRPRSEYEDGGEMRRRGGSRYEYGGGEEIRRDRPYNDGGEPYDRGRNMPRSGGYDSDEYPDAEEPPEMRRRYRRDRDGRFAPRNDGGSEPRPFGGDEWSRPLERMGFDGGQPQMQGHVIPMPYPHMASAQRETPPMMMGSAEHDGSMKLTKEKAEEWMRSLQNEDGTKGAHWTLEQAKQLMAQKNIRGDPLEFWVAMNIIYSDYVGVAKKSNANSIDFYAGMAEAFLKDADASGDKLGKYYEYIVKR